MGRIVWESPRLFYARLAGTDWARGPKYRLEAEQVDALLTGRAFTDVLDLAGGDGRHALRLAGRGARVTVLDASPEMLACGRTRAARAGLPVVFFEHDLETALPFPPLSFDLVLCALALGHLHTIAALLVEAARVLRPGGYLLLSDDHPEVIADLLQAARAYEAAAGDGETVRVLPYVQRTRQEHLAAVGAAGLDLAAVRDVPTALLVPPDRRLAGVEHCLLVLLAQKPVLVPGTR